MSGWVSFAGLEALAIVKGYSQVIENGEAVELEGYVAFSKVVICMHRLEFGSGRISLEFTEENG
jgi:hypothetical protein